MFLVVCDCDGGDEYDDKYDLMLLNGGSKWSDGNLKYNQDCSVAEFLDLRCLFYQKHSLLTSVNTL
mgnify:CR=1 FL=1